MSRPILSVLFLSALLSACGTSTPTPHQPTAGLTPERVPACLQTENLQPQFDYPAPGPCSVESVYMNLINLGATSPRAQYVVDIAMGSSAQYRSARNAYWPIQNGALQWRTLSVPYAGISWESDGCSAPGMMLVWNLTFAAACDLHDFGYSNVGIELSLDAINRPDANVVRDHEWLRKAVDDQFLRNMRAICATSSLTGCSTVANTYYNAVREYGGSHWLTWYETGSL